MMIDTTLRRRVRSKRATRAVLGVAMAASLAACSLDEVLEVEEREFPTDETLRDPSALPLLIRGAIGEFYRAYAGSGLDNLAFATAVALFTDELESVDTFSDRNALDARNLQPPAIGNASDFAFVRLQRARRATRDAAASVQEVRGANDPERATLLALEGYSYVALAEGWCSAVPISDVVGAEFVQGAPMTTQQLLDAALVRFDASMAAAPSDLARVGRGRALLNLGRFADAAAAVSPVPQGFVWSIEHSENTFQNSFWNLSNNNRRMSVSDVEGGTGMPWRSAGDPRVEWLRGINGTRVGFDEITPLYEPQKYPDRDADVPLADWREARLIEAEAALQSDDVPLFLERLNDLRDGVSGLAELADPGTTAGRVDLLFRERAFWLYLTGHRLGDLRRLVTQYSRSVGSVYPVGASVRGTTYGNDVVLPVPFNEEQNDLFDRSMCVTTQI